jgi:hypothetical protein
VELKGVASCKKGNENGEIAGKRCELQPLKGENTMCVNYRAEMMAKEKKAKEDSILRALQGGKWDECDKRLDDFAIVADNLEIEKQRSRADAVRYLIQRVKSAEERHKALKEGLKNNVVGYLRSAGVEI